MIKTIILVENGNINDHNCVARAASIQVHFFASVCKNKDVKNQIQDWEEKPSL